MGDKTFVFVMVEGDAVMDSDGNLNDLSFSVKAPNLAGAFEKLAGYLTTLGDEWSDDPADYATAADHGEIIVTIPTAIED